jgi:hypothetical protein
LRCRVWFNGNSNSLTTFPHCHRGVPRGGQAQAGSTWGGTPLWCSIPPVCRSRVALRVELVRPCPLWNEGVRYRYDDMEPPAIWAYSGGEVRAETWLDRFVECFIHRLTGPPDSRRAWRGSESAPSQRCRVHRRAPNPPDRPQPPQLRSKASENTLTMAGTGGTGPTREVIA